MWSFKLDIPLLISFSALLALLVSLLFPISFLCCFSLFPIFFLCFSRFTASLFFLPGIFSLLYLLFSFPDILSLPYLLFPISFLSLSASSLSSISFLCFSRFSAFPFPDILFRLYLFFPSPWSIPPLPSPPPAYSTPFLFPPSNPSSEYWFSTLFPQIISFIHHSKVHKNI